MPLFNALLIFAAALAFVYWRLHVTNMEIPPTAERRLSTRDALRFALDNNIPIK